MPFPFSNGDVLQASDMNALNRLPPVADTGTSRTLALTDESTWISKQASGSMTITIPPNSSVAFPLGAQILIGRQTSATVTIARGAGVSLFGVLGNKDYSIANQDGFVTLLKGNTDSWYIMGDVA